MTSVQMRRAWLAALCTVVGIGCTDGEPAIQVLTGKMGTAGAVAIRAVAEDAVVTAAPIRSDGSFTLSLPAGQKYRLEVLTSDGVKQILSHQDGWRGLEFKVCAATAPFDVGAIGDSPTCDPNAPGCVPCADPTDPNCMPPPEPCTVAADGTTTCPPPCSDPMDPGCQPPPPCGGPSQPACPPPPCSDPTDPNCMPPEPCLVEPDGTITCPPPPCSDPMDPNCMPPPPPCSDPMDPNCMPPPPPCSDPTDPDCMPPPPLPCGGPNEPACPPPPPCSDPTDPNCPPPEPCMIAADGTMTCPPPPCGDPMDPNTCQDPCVTDPTQCGCPPTEPNCWPPPEPMPCDPSGMCAPGGTMTPQHVPGDFGCVEPVGA